MLNFQVLKKLIKNISTLLPTKQCIRNARFTIWVAVAWFTDKDLGNELRKKHRSRMNVRVIVNDDQITEQQGLQFYTKGIEYTIVSPESPWGKKLMQNIITKAC